MLRRSVIVYVVELLLENESCCAVLGLSVLSYDGVKVLAVVELCAAENTAVEQRNRFLSSLLNTKQVSLEEENMHSENRSSCLPCMGVDFDSVASKVINRHEGWTRIIEHLLSFLYKHEPCVAVWQLLTCFVCVLG